jgi:hypothetical protein
MWPQRSAAQGPAEPQADGLRGRCNLAHHTLLRALKDHRPAPLPQRWLHVRSASAAQTRAEPERHGPGRENGGSIELVEVAAADGAAFFSPPHVEELAGVLAAFSKRNAAVVAPHQPRQAVAAAGGYAP